MTNDRNSIQSNTCAAWCNPKKYRFCMSAICCPHLHTPQAVAARNNSKGSKR